MIAQTKLPCVPLPRSDSRSSREKKHLEVQSRGRSFICGIQRQTKSSRTKHMAVTKSLRTNYERPVSTEMPKRLQAATSIVA